MKSIITVGLGFGDEGKGTIVDHLVRANNAQIVIRYNGGAQAVHNVIDDDGRHHAFHQFGSGTLVPDVKTFLSKHMLVNPLLLVTEAVELERIGVPEALRLVHIDERALITTPFHRAMNRLREYSRKDSRHGSCGLGIGETRMDAERRRSYAVRAGDLLDEARLRDRLWRCRNEMVAQAKQLPLEKADFEHPLVEKELGTFDCDFDLLVKRYIDFAGKVFILDKTQASELLTGDGVAVFEGAQGTLLDETYGFHPYTTWSDCTTANAHEIIREFGLGNNLSEIGIMRTYSTRHGPGPFPTYHKGLTELVGPMDHNGFNEWQRDFRCGWLDIPFLKYAIRMNGGVDSLAVTHVDKLRLLDQWLVCRDYYALDVVPSPDLVNQEKLTRALMAATTYESEYYDAGKILDMLEESLSTPISITSHGPKSGDKKARMEKCTA